jgi:hypothetical protein
MLRLAPLLGLSASLALTAGCGDDGANAGGAAGSSSSADTTGSSELTSATSGSTSSGMDDLAAESDTFDGAALDPSWTVFNDAALDATVSAGALHLELTAPALWFQASRGTLVHKSVTGDFRVTATVHARKTSAPSEPPDTTIHLGGLMARDPASDAGMENYVFIVVGFDENDVSVETKSTTNDMSDYVGPTWPQTEAELRLCRVGSSFRLYKRPVGGTMWQEAMVYDRPDMPATLQVGPNAYSLSMPDLTVDFDEVTFARVSSVADCTL